MIIISYITCYKTVTKTAKYEGKLKKRGGSQVSSGALAKYLSRRSSASAKKPAKHVAEPHGQVKTGTKEPEHRESGTGPK